MIIYHGLIHSNPGLKQRKTTGDGNTKNLQIVVPLKYLSSFWRTLEMLLARCEINLDLTWSEYGLFLVQLEKQNLQ